MPAAVVYSDTSKDFSVPLLTDNTNCGAYLITIRNEISVPDDAEKSSFTPMVVEYDFTIFIEPCSVDTYT